jgi:hypothetical protein
VTTTTSNWVVVYEQPWIELSCEENAVGAYEWVLQPFDGSWNWDRSAGFGSITFDYGDGKSYTSWTNDDAEANAFWHKYYSPGLYTVRATITDSSGQKDSASCSWTWDWGSSAAPSATTTTKPRAAVTTTQSPSSYVTAPSQPQIAICMTDQVEADWPDHGPYGDYEYSWAQPNDEGGASMLRYEVRIYDPAPIEGIGYYQDGDDDPYNNPTYDSAYITEYYIGPGSVQLNDRSTLHVADLKVIVVYDDASGLPRTKRSWISQEFEFGEGCITEP